MVVYCDQQTSGNTWDDQDNPTSANPSGVFAVDANILWAVGDSRVLLTLDGGTPWVNRTGNLSSLALSLADSVGPVDGSTAWVIGISPQFQPRIYKTVDAGISWFEQNPKGG